MSERDTAVTFVVGGDEVVVPWRELHEQAKGYAAALQARGVRPGDHVALLSPTTSTITRRLKFKSDIQYRVRVTDNDANQSDWAVGLIYRVGVVSEGAASITRTGRWPIVSRNSALGMSSRRARSQSAANTRGVSAAVAPQMQYTMSRGWAR